MDNAGRRNIHARPACREAGMDRQAPSPDEDDHTGMSKIVHRSRCETLRPAPPRHSRTTHPRIRPRIATRNRNVRRCQELRVPNLGENWQEFLQRSGELREDGCLQRRPSGSAVFSIWLTPRAPSSTHVGQRLPKAWRSCHRFPSCPDDRSVSRPGGRRSLVPTDPPPALLRAAILAILSFV